MTKLEIIPGYQEGYTRMDLLNMIAGHINAQSYLEIGSGNGICFNEINVPTKVGVDPQPNNTKVMTSDEFFEQNKDFFDLIFIDGLHHAPQAYEDVRNSLHALNGGGVIVMHDCMPWTREMQIVPQETGTWTGDVWKVAFVLQELGYVDFCLVKIDMGCGILIPRTSTHKVDLGHKDNPLWWITDSSYDDYLTNLPKMNRIAFEEVEQWLNS